MYNKILSGILVVLLIAIIGALGYLGYGYFSKYNTEKEAELVQSVIRESLDFKEDDEIEKNVSYSYEYDIINKFNTF